ncbi:MAG: efflux RND transporter permease subunit [Balneolales bacterium]
MMKKLPALAVKRPVTFIMISLIVIGFGIFGLNQLRLNLYPDVSFPTITVYTTYEGVAPEDMETLVTRPLEESVGTVSGLSRVRSLSSQGASVVKLYFNWDTDLFIAESDVRKQVDFARRAIPRDADSPIVFSYDPNQEPVTMLTLSSNTRSSRDLRTIAVEQLEQRLERIEGIASATTSGGLERQINVTMRNESILAHNVDLSTISGILNNENVQVPAGELTDGQTVYSLRTIGEYKSAQEIRDAVISLEDGRSVALGDIADVEDGIAQPIGNVHVNGEDGLIISVYRQSDANIVTAADNLLDNMNNIRSTLPDDVELEVLTNRADFIQTSLSNLYQTGLQAVVLVIIILLLFLRSGRSAFVIAISIPVSIITTFSIMHFANVSLNVISLSGLTLAVGLVVDNAVVVLENIFRFRKEGQDAKTASVNGAQEVIVPVIVSTLTTLVVFLPILFVPGIAGFLFRDLALTVSFALIMSTLAAVTLIPLMSSRLLESAAKDQRNRLTRASAKLAEFRRTSSITHVLGVLPQLFLHMLQALLVPFRKIGSVLKKYFSKIGQNFEHGFEKLDAGYSNLLNSFLDRSFLVILTTILIFASTLPIFQRLGGEFFPPVDESAFALSIEREPGVSLLELEETFHQVEGIIREQVPEARLIVSDYGDKRGVEGAENPGGNHGIVRIELISGNDRDRDQFEITSALLESLQEVPGAQVTEIRENPLNPEGDDGLIVQLFGYEQEVRSDLSSVIRDGMSDIPGFVNVSSSGDQGRPELRVVMDRERISRNGLTSSQVANAISDNVRGNTATSLVSQGVEFEVLVQLDPRQRNTSDALEDIQIRNSSGQWMPLHNLARIERYNGPSNILRVNQERVTEIQADLTDIDLKQGSDEARNYLDQINWPDGYRYEIGGTAEEQQESFQYLMIAFLIAGILAYMVMASQFESLLEPFVIIMTIPLALTGVLIMLWLTSTPISVTAMIGLILLSGIVVNNGIVMIDYIKVLQSRGIERKEAVVQGASRRLRPILMTASTTILAMVPLALELGTGAETWSPMARTVIGGLTTSTILMLLVVPCIYYLINQGIGKIGFESVNETAPVSKTTSS